MQLQCLTPHGNAAPSSGLPASRAAHTPFAHLSNAGWMQSLDPRPDRGHASRTILRSAIRRRPRPPTLGLRESSIRCGGCRRGLS